MGIALLVGDDAKFLATVTDGDVRRAILNGHDLQVPLAEALVEWRGKVPLTAQVGTSRARLRSLMIEREVRHLPIIDDMGRPSAVVTLEGLTAINGEAPRALVMAGGFGKRLGDLTANTPKPLLEVGGRPMMDYVIERLKQAGVEDITVSVHFLGDQIRAHYGGGEAFGVSITYVEEIQPMGTAGAISLLEPSQRSLIVTNADVMTSLPFSSLAEFHEEHDADFTIAVSQQEHRVPFGVVECNGLLVKRITEKPSLPYLISAGIYVLSPEVQSAVPPGKRVDMPDLIQLMLNSGSTIYAYPLNSYWRDVGRPDDYRRAQIEMPGVTAARSLPTE